MSGDAGTILIHGGRSRALVWSRMLPFVEPPALAVDLPGRDDPSRHVHASFDQWARAVIAEMDGAGMDRAVVVGHSMAGGTLAALARHFPRRVLGAIFFAAVTPPDGAPFLEGLSEAQQAYMRRSREAGLSTLANTAAAVVDAADPLARLRRDSESSEALAPFFERVSLAGFADVHVGFVKLLRDRSLDLARQEQFIVRLRQWGPCEVRSVDASHMAMISAPRESAEAINAISAAFVRAGARGGR